MKITISYISHKSLVLNILFSLFFIFLILYSTYLSMNPNLYQQIIGPDGTTQYTIESVSLFSFIHILFIISTIMVMLIGVLIYSVYAADYTTSGLAENAGRNSATFWNAKVGETITDDIPDPPSGCNATKWWLCLQHNVVSSLGDGAKIRAIIDIDVNTVGEYTASINNGDGRTVTKDNDRNIKKLAYFIYAATVSTNTGYPASGTDAKKQLYTYIINGNIDAYIGDFADKLTYDNTYYKATIDSYANDYASSYSKGSNAEITKENDDGAKVTIRNVNGRTYSYLGPFSLKTGGSISSVSITDGNKSATVVGYANSLDGKINTTESELPKNGNKFYGSIRGNNKKSCYWKGIKWLYKGKNYIFWEKQRARSRDIQRGYTNIRNNYR